MYYELSITQILWLSALDNAVKIRKLHLMNFKKTICE